MNKQEAIRHVYAPPRGRREWELEDLVGHDRIRYFNFGRHALLQGLVAAGVGRGDTVLLPGLICRDLLAPLNLLGVKPVFYQVNRGLEPCLDDLPHAKAIIAVDYFGFPQDLAVFRHYCRQTGAILVEDSIQGFLSRDGEGRLLGTRGDLGIMGLRKTLPVPDGALLLVNNSSVVKDLPPQILFTNQTPFSFRMKEAARRLVPFVGVLPLRVATRSARFLRRLRTGHAIEPTGEAGEHTMPVRKAPSANLLPYLYAADILKEARRRRELYTWVSELLNQSPCEYVFEGLPDQTVPLGFPFYARPDAVDIIKKILRVHRLECFPWPELPGAVVPVAPDHYRNLWVVHFLW